MLVNAAGASSRCVQQRALDVCKPAACAGFDFTSLERWICETRLVMNGASQLVGVHRGHQLQETACPPEPRARHPTGAQQDLQRASSQGFKAGTSFEQ